MRQWTMREWKTWQNQCVTDGRLINAQHITVVTAGQSTLASTLKHSLQK